MINENRIIFIGTSEFSVPALKALINRKDCLISLVVTQPDRPKGRGRKLCFSPVKNAAINLDIEIFQPEKLNSEENRQKLLSYKPDFLVVAAYGQILSQDILSIPKKYPINIHASLLPKYRGASPIQAAVQNRDTKSGVTTIVMSDMMDAGDILLKAELPLDPEYTALDLHDVLAELGGNLILETIDRINNGTLIPIPQNHSMATYVPMLKKKDGNIDWNKTPEQIKAHINAMIPWPGAFTHLDGKRLKIFKTMPDPETLPSDTMPGEIYRLSPYGIHVGARKRGIIILELMSSSGKKMKVKNFLNGMKINLPSRFQSETQHK